MNSLFPFRSIEELTTIMTYRPNGVAYYIFLSITHEISRHVVLFDNYRSY